MLCVILHLRRTAELHGYVADVPMVISEKVADHLALVSEAENEVLVSLRGIIPHHVPEDRATADRDHRFQTELGFFAQACAETAAEDDDFHRIGARKTETHR